MLHVLGRRKRLCDGITRRDLMQVGGLSLFGSMTIPRLLRAADSSQGAGPAKSVMLFNLLGGPAHMDMFDMKPDAPAKIRGEFKPIDTSVPGIQICELFPKLAGMMDKLVVIRSVVGNRNEHSPYMCYSGYSEKDFREKDRPCLGSFVSRIQGPADRSAERASGRCRHPSRS